MLSKLTDYKCIVTGGTGALGQAVVEEYLRAGAIVISNFRNREKFEKLRSGSFAPKRWIGFEADLTNPESAGKFFSAANQTLRRLDVFIHTMGGFWMGQPLSTTPLENWHKMMDLNLFSTLLCTQQAFKIMQSQCNGKIFTISAKTALDLPAGMGAYSVSKAAVLALSETLAKEGKDYNIQVNSLLPGIIDTPANRLDMPDANFSDWVSPKRIGQLLVNLSAPEIEIISETAIKIFGKI